MLSVGETDMGVPEQSDTKLPKNRVSTILKKKQLKKGRNITDLSLSECSSSSLSIEIIEQKSTVLPNKPKKPKMPKKRNRKKSSSSGKKRRNNPIKATKSQRDKSPQRPSLLGAKLITPKKVRSVQKKGNGRKKNGDLSVRPLPMLPRKPQKSTRKRGFEPRREFYETRSTHKKESTKAELSKTISPAKKHFEKKHANSREDNIDTADQNDSQNSNSGSKIREILRSEATESELRKVDSYYRKKDDSVSVSSLSFKIIDDGTPSQSSGSERGD